MISIIIPALNEAGTIGPLVRYLDSCAHRDLLHEIIVSDGGSSDATVREAAGAGALVVTGSPGRGPQLNRGAARASGDTLYFLHADTRPPATYLHDIYRARQQGHRAGGYRLRFDTPHPLLRFYGWCTRWPLPGFRYGDQSLFVDAALFREAGGYREDHLIMEDNEIVQRLQRHTPYHIMDGEVITSARTYLDNGIVRLQLIFALIYFLYRTGSSQQRLLRFYRRWIRNERKPDPQAAAPGKEPAALSHHDGTPLAG